MIPAKRKKRIFRRFSGDYYKSAREYILPFSLLLGSAGALLWYTTGSFNRLILTYLVLAVSFFLLLEVIRQVSLITHHLYQSGINQMQSLQAIYSILDPKLPLPSMARWAGNPDFCQLLMKQILLSNPKVVLELGSGVSTVVAGLTLQKTGGRIYSVEHDRAFKAETEIELANQGLDEFARVYESPLKDTAVDVGSFRWYDLSVLDEIPDIDLLVIDGPPGNIQNLSRYPALPILYGKLAKEAVIIMDDGRRRDEKQIVAMWLDRYVDLESRFIDTEKGTFLITRKGNRTV